MRTHMGLHPNKKPIQSVAQDKIQAVRDHMNVSTDKAKLTCSYKSKILGFVVGSLIEAKTLSR